uniref:Vesicle transport protein n=1 Tax=Peronospora matthiolae TaxID=2874970 RepID=A0AAV1VHT5_9STRA
MLCTSAHHVRFSAFFYSLSNLATFPASFYHGTRDIFGSACSRRKRSKAGRAWMGALALTIVVAFVWPSHWFTVIVLLVLQVGCMIWYSVSVLCVRTQSFLHTYMAKRVVLVDAMDGKIDGK